MLKLPTRFVMAFLAIGLLVGAATTATIMSTGLKPFNLALAQLRAPFLAQQPQVQAPLQQQAITAASPSGGAGSFGPNCAGCVTTQNLANGAVTTQKIAPGAVSMTTQSVVGQQSQASGNSQALAGFVTCPPGTVIVGGGFTTNGAIVFASSLQANLNGVQGWSVSALTPSSGTPPGGGSWILSPEAECVTVHP